MSVTLGFVSRDGFLISATADTSAEALGELVAHCGEDVADAYEIARREIAGLVTEMVSEADPRLPAPGPAAAPAAGGDADRAARPGVPTGEPAADSAVPAPPAEVEQGAGAGAPPNGPKVLPPDPGPGVAAPSCSICGLAIPAGLAEVTTRRYGDARCPTCAA